MVKIFISIAIVFETEESLYHGTHVTATSVEIANVVPIRVGVILPKGFWCRGQELVYLVLIHLARLKCLAYQLPAPYCYQRWNHKPWRVCTNKICPEVEWTDAEVHAI